MKGTHVAKALVVLNLTVLAIGLAFRAFIYRRMYIAPGDPYGFSDVIEFLLGWLLIGLLSVSVAVAIALAVRGPRRNRIAASWLTLVVAAVVLLTGPLHELAAKWAI